MKKKENCIKQPAVNYSIQVIVDDIELNPKCPHGPTLLFRKLYQEKLIKEYYACSAYRSLNGCNFYLNRHDFKGKIKKKYSNINFQPFEELRNKIKVLKSEETSYCHTCNLPFDSTKNFHNHATHEKIMGINNKTFLSPTKFLRPLSNDKAEAQYFFKDTTLSFFESILIKLKITKAICIGVPTLHEYLRLNYPKLKIKSILLDFDHRFFYFNDENEFIYYNMFNNHFFEGKKKIQLFKDFLKINENEIPLIITDPPFGCRTEPLISTLHKISSLYRNVNNFLNILPIFWIFPYFMESYIKHLMPEMNMVEYKINYSNHSTYCDFGKSARKQGSPVRLFTNVPLNIIELPKTEGYKYCSLCEKWTGNENYHCNFCNQCPSKNGETYRHCFLCSLCVKPNLYHCENCSRCTHVENHNCSEYQKHIKCWICGKKGHIERNCIELNGKIIRKCNIVNGERVCLICTKNGHNELNCPHKIK